MKNSLSSLRPKNKSRLGLRCPPVPPSFSQDEFAAWRRPDAAPYALEIGCGVGFHPIGWAKQNTNGQILAVERTTNKFLKFRGRLERHSHLSGKVYAAHADASWLLPHLAAHEMFDECFWLYPNPEPKRRNHRIAYSTFTDEVVARLKIGGRLTIATNIAAYVAEVRRELTKKYAFDLIVDEIVGATAPPRSHFEKKYLARGEPCFNMVFIKTANDNNYL